MLTDKMKAPKAELMQEFLILRLSIQRTSNKYDEII
jgi:hypothetical protein